MKMSSLRLFIFYVLLTMTLQNAFAGVCDISGSGIGGTGAPRMNNGGSGIGGTGAPASKKNGSGIGGTGAIANGSGIGGTGQPADNQNAVIIGTITGFGSICVNGIEIHYTDSTPVQVNGESTSTEQLAIGQVVSVNVSGSGSEVFAKDINVMNIVAGPITEIEPLLNRITVLGQRVQLSEKTHFSVDQAERTQIQKGSFIQVSGLRQAGGDIIASRIEPFVSRNTVHLSGTATHVTAKGFTIGGMNIETGGQATIKENQVVSVDGQLLAGKVIARQIIIPSISDNRRVNIEGFVHIDGRGEQIKIAHVVVESNEHIKNVLLDIKPNQTVIVDGTMQAEHGLKIDHVFIKELVETPEIQSIHQEKYKDDVDSKEQKLDEPEQSEKNHLQKEIEQERHTENQDIEKEDDNSELTDIKVEERKSIEEDESGLGGSELEIDDHEMEGDESVEVEVSEQETPEDDDPEVDEPETEVPEIDESEAEIHEIEETETPEVEVSEIEIPEVEEPEIETPEVEVPEIED